MKKQNLPSKICPVCERPFVWRKKTAHAATYSDVWGFHKYEASLFEISLIFFYPIGFVIPSRIKMSQNIKYSDVSDDLNGGQYGGG